VTANGYTGSPGGVVSVAGRTGAVVLGQSDITGLTAALADKATDAELTDGLALKMAITGGSGFTMSNDAAIATAGASRADIGFSSAARGAGVELYKDDHATRPGGASFVYGAGDPGVGSVRFIHYDGVDYYARVEVLPDGGTKIYNSSAPATPSGGGVLYVESGALKYINPAGTITALESGGGGGTTPTVVRASVTSGDITQAAEGSWTPVTGLTLSIAAAVGDQVELSGQCLIDVGVAATDFFDPVVLVGGSIVRYGSTGTGSPAAAGEGDPGLYPSTGVRFRGSAMFMSLEVEAGDLDGGNVVFGLAHKGSGSSKVFASANYPFRWRARNDHS
jgi:hypothetical protein